MKIDAQKFKIALARVCKSARDLRKDGFSSTTVYRAMKGEELTEKTAGKIARALGVDITEIMIEEEVKQ